MRDVSHIAFKKLNDEGFTLIELLIVVAIIGILAAIAIPAYMGFTTKAKVSGALTHVGSLKSAIEVVAADRGASNDATTIGEISQNFGINFSTQYISAASVTALTTNPLAGGVLSVTIGNTGVGDADGTTIIGTPFRSIPSGQITGWQWGGTLPNKYRTSAVQ